MAAFGENLRREREMRGVTLEEISLATKISVRFLQAIENEEFQALPGGIFTRSFIRTYARYLGLDDERVMAEYQLVGQPKAEEDLHKLAVGRPSAQRPSSRAPLLALLVAAIMLGGGYLLFRYSRRVAEVPVRQTYPEPVAAAPAPAPGVTTSPSSSSSTPTPAAPPNPEGTAASGTSTASPTVNPPGPSPGPTESPSQTGGTATPPGQPAEKDSGLLLQVAATERAWVGIEADGKTVLQGVLKPNEVRTLKARESFDVTTGNAQGIILTLNGETLKPLGRRGEVKSIHLTHDDVKTPAP